LAPAQGHLHYVQLPKSQAARELVKLSELGYARFCLDFEAATTRWILESSLRPDSTCIVVNDVSEGPDLARLARAGYRIVSLWHVDVVDYFGKIYFKNAFRPESLVGAYEFFRRAGAARALPSVLKLVFEKQRQTVAKSARLIFPSTAMASVVGRCYGGVAASPEGIARRSLVVPWGSWEDGADEGKVLALRQELRARHRIGAETSTLMTLSRLAPEKGIDLLLKALLRLESEGFAETRDIVLFVCGEAAFMKGQSTLKRLKKLTGQLKKVRIFFTGHLDPIAKRAHLGLCDLFVSPSIHESYGLTIVEAMRAGLPILALNHYGVRETLRPDYGRVVEPRSIAQAPSELAGAIQELLSDNDRLRAMGHRAQAAALKMPFGAAAQSVLDAALDFSPEGIPV
jgi:glycosyltransferase involved in cell wall biosynthesis